VLINASVTAALVNWAVSVIHALGYPGEMLLTGMSQVFIVPGTEPVLMFSGFNVDTHHFTLVLAIMFGIIGDVLGAVVAYYIGYFGLTEILARKGPLHIEPDKMRQAEHWFEKYGVLTVVVSRWIPVFRSAPVYAAGTVKMPFWKFLPLTAIGSLVWCGAWVLVGKAVGSQWQQWKHHLDYVDYAVVAIVVVAVVWWVAKKLRQRRLGVAG
jgi:membrane protein DedA with SNARE-associated domain